jgi:hypothetical protein
MPPPHTALSLAIELRTSRAEIARREDRRLRVAAVRVLLEQWEFSDESRAAESGVCNLNATAVQPDRFAYQGKAQARAAALAAPATGIGAVEAIEDPLSFFGWDAWAVVLDP